MSSRLLTLLLVEDSPEDRDVSQTTVKELDKQRYERSRITLDVRF